MSQRFGRALGRAAAWLRLAFLRLDGRAIAFEFILAHDHPVKAGVAGLRAQR